jgi:hypothetical protein
MFILLNNIVESYSRAYNIYSILCLLEWWLRFNWSAIESIYTETSASP